MKKFISTIILIQLTFLYADNYSLSFDGVDDWVQVDYASNLDLVGSQNFTIQSYVKVNSDVYPFALFHTGNDGDPENSIRINVGIQSIAVHWEYNGGTNYILESSGLPNYGWNHVSFTWGGDTVKLYVNGELVNLDVPPSGPGDTADRDYYFGSEQGGNTLNGNIDEVSIWNSVLTQEEIQSYMSTPPTGSETGLVGY